MKTKLILALLFLFYTGKQGVMAQGTAVPPDCQVFFAITAAGSAPLVNGFDNRASQCVTWTVAYESTGFSGLTIAFQSSVGATTPTSFGAYTGTTVFASTSFGTSTTGGIATYSNLVTGLVVNTPWVRVNVSGLTGTGTIRGVIYGYRTGYTGGTGGGGGGSGGTGCPNPCPVIGPTAVGAIPAVAPVVVGGVDNATGAVRTLLTDTNGNLLPNVNIVKVGGGNVAGGGGAGTLGVGGPAAAGAAAGNPFVTGYRDDSGNAQADYGFPDQVAVTISAGTDTVMVTGVMSTQTYVGHLSFTLDSAQTVTIRQGTGANCGTSTLILYGPAPALVGVALDFDSRGGLHTTIAARDLCLHLGGSATVGGGIWYGQH